MQSHPEDTIIEIINPTHLLNNADTIFRRPVHIIGLTETRLPTHQHAMFQSLANTNKWTSGHTATDPNTPDPHAGTTLMARKPRRVVLLEPRVQALSEAILSGRAGLYQVDIGKKQ